MDGFETRVVEFDCLVFPDLVGGITGVSVQESVLSKMEGVDKLSK